MYVKSSSAAWEDFSHRGMIVPMRKEKNSQRKEPSWCWHISRIEQENHEQQDSPKSPSSDLEIFTWNVRIGWDSVYGK